MERKHAGGTAILAAGWLLVAGMLCSVVSADTVVPGGTISTDTTWSAAGSPYIVQGLVTVQGTDGADSVTSLTIESGVEVRFDGPANNGLDIGMTAPGALIVGTGYSLSYALDPLATANAGDVRLEYNAGLSTAARAVFDVVVYGALADVYSVSFDLGYDETLLGFVSAEATTALDDAGCDLAGGCVTLTTDDAPVNALSVSMTRSEPGAAGAGVALSEGANVLLRLTFDALAAGGPSAVAFATPHTTSVVNDSTATDISADWFGGDATTSAIGTAPILTSNAAVPAPGDWYGLRFGPSASQAVTSVSALEVHYAGRSRSGVAAGVVVDGSSPALSGVSVSQSGGDGIYVAGTASPSVTNCSVVSPVGYGIRFGAGATGASFDSCPQIDNNFTFSSNDAGTGANTSSITNSTLNGFSAKQPSVPIDSVGRVFPTNTFNGVAAGDAITILTIGGFNNVTRDAAWPGQLGGENITYLMPGAVSQIVGTDGADNVTTLTLGAGATLKWAGGTQGLNVGDGVAPGALVVNGAALNPVTMTVVSEPGSWCGLHFTASANAAVSAVDYLHVRYGGGNCNVGAGNDAGIRVSGPAVPLNNVTISNSNENGLMLTAGNASVTNLTVSTAANHGIYVSGGSPTLTGGSVSGALWNGVHVLGGATPSISGMTVTAPADNGFYVSAAAPTINDCTVTNAGTNGFYVQGVAAPVVTNCSVVTPAGYGIRFEGGASNASFNLCPQIDNNFTFIAGSVGLSTSTITNSVLNNFSAKQPSVPLNSVGRVLPGNTFNGVLAGDAVTVFTDVANSNWITADATWPGQLGGVAMRYLMPPVISQIRGTSGADGVTALTLGAGAELRFPVGGYALDVGDGVNPGALIVNGTALDPVVMTSAAVTPAAGDWFGVYFSPTTSAAVTNVNYLTVRYGGRDVTGNVEAGFRFNGAGGGTFNNLRSESSWAHGFSFYGGATATLTDAVSQGGAQHGIYVEGASPTITGGTVNAAGVNGIHVTSAAAPSITGTVITSPVGAGVYSNSASAFTVDGVSVSSPGTYGVHLVGSSPTIQNSSFTGGTNGVYSSASSPTINNCQIITPTGYGLFFTGASSATVMNCPRLDNMLQFDSAVGKNTVTGNTFYGFNPFPPVIPADDVGVFAGSGGNAFNGVLSGSRVVVLGETVAYDAAWPAQLAATPIAYDIQSTVAVQGSDGGDFVTTLTLAPGATLKFASGAALDIGGASAGALVADGTSVNPVTFTSNKAVPARGDWFGVYLSNLNREGVSVLDFCVIEYGGQDRFVGYDGLLRIVQTDQLVTNTTLRESGDAGMVILNGGPTFQNGSISNVNTVGIFLDGASATIQGSSILNTGQHGVEFGTGTNSNTFLNNTISNGLFYGGSTGSNEFQGNTFVSFNGSLSRLAAGDVNGVTSDTNTFEDCEGTEYIEVLGGTLTSDASWSSTFCSSPVAYKIIGGSLTVSGTDGVDSVTTLTLQAGGKMVFDPGLGLDVGTGSQPGALVLNGSTFEPIVLTSSQTSKARGDWNGVYLGANNNSAVTKFNYVTIEYGGQFRFGNDANLRMNATKATVTNSLLQESANHGVALFGGSMVNLTNTTNQYNTGSGIYSDASTATLDASPITGCGAYGVYANNSTLTLQNASHVTGVGNYGVYMAGSSANLTASNCNIDNNFWIASATGANTVTNCTFSNFSSYPPSVPANEVGPILFSGGNTFGGVTAGNVVRVLNETVSKDATWQKSVSGANVVYSVEGGGWITVAGQDGGDFVTTLTLAPGLMAKFAPSTGIYVGTGDVGALVAKGTAVERITLTSSAVTPARGDWRGLRFDGGNKASITGLSYADISYAGQSTASLYVYYTALSMSETTISESALNALRVESSPNFTASKVQINGANQNGVYAYWSGNVNLTDVSVSNVGQRGFYGDSSAGLLTNVSATTVGATFYGFDAIGSASYTVSNSIFDQSFRFNSATGANSIKGSTFNNVSAYPPTIPANEVGPTLFANSNTFNGMAGTTPIGVLTEIVSNDQTWQKAVAGNTIFYDVVTTDGVIDVYGTDGADGVTTLTIAPGATLKMGTRAYLRVGNGGIGALYAVGTLTEPVTFTSRAATPVAGDWRNLRFQTNTDASRTRLEHCIIEYGGYDNDVGNVDLNSIASPGITLDNVTIRNGANWGLHCYYGRFTMTNSLITNMAERGMFITGGTSVVTVRDTTIQNVGWEGIRTYYQTRPTLENVTIINPGTAGAYYGMYFDNESYATVTNCTVDRAFTFNSSVGANSIKGSTFNNVSAYPPTIPANEVGPTLFGNGNTFNGMTGTTPIGVLTEEVSLDQTWQKAIAGNAIFYDVVTGAGILEVRGTDGADGVTTLTISPGVTVKMASTAYVRVGSGGIGALWAVGTSAEPILFTSRAASPAPGDWRHIRFDSGTDASRTRMEHCVVEYAGSSNNLGNIHLDGIASPGITLDNVTIRNGANWGLFCYYGRFTMTNSLIQNMVERGMYIEGNSSIVTVQNTTIQNVGWEGILTYNQTVPTFENVTITNPGTAGSYYGMYFDNTSYATVINCTVDRAFTFNSSVGANTITGSTFNNVSAYPPTIPANEVGPTLFTNGNTFNNMTGTTPIGVLTEIVSLDQTWQKAVAGNGIFYDVVTGAGILDVRGTDGADGVTTLTISPGVTVKMASTAYVRVGSGGIGALWAVGTSAEPILFTSRAATPAAGDWRHIRFDSGTDASRTRMERCVVEYAGSSNNLGNIHLDGIASPGITLDNVTIRNGANWGLFCYYGRFTMTNSLIQNMVERGMYIEGGTSVVTVRDTTIQNVGWEGIRTYWQTVPTFKNVTITNPGTAGSYYGMYFDNTSYATVINCTVDHNFTFNSASGANTITGSTFNDFSAYPPTIPANEVGQILFGGGNTFNGVQPDDTVAVLCEDVTFDTTWPNALSSTGIRYDVGACLLYVRGTDGADLVTTLTLTPGVKMRFGSGGQLRVGDGGPGALYAKGTVAQKIIFTSSNAAPAKGAWRGLYFAASNEPSLSRLEHCVVEYGGQSNWALVDMYSTSLNVADCTLRKGNHRGLYVHDGSKAVVSGALIEDVNNRGVELYWLSSLTATNSTIRNTGQEGIYGYNYTMNLDGVKVENPGFTRYGIHSGSNPANVTLNNCTVDHNFMFESANGANTFTNSVFNDFSAFPPSIPANEIGQILFSGGNTFNGVQPADEVTVLNEQITKDATWPGGLSGQALHYCLSGDVFVGGADGPDFVTTLTLNPGATLKFVPATAARLRVADGSTPGALSAAGLPSAPITFTSAAKSPAPGDWQGVLFDNAVNEALTVLNNCVFEYGGTSGGGWYANLYFYYNNVSSYNIVSRRALYDGFRSYGGTNNVATSQFYLNGRNGLLYDYTSGGTVVGCTINQNAVGVYFYYSNAVVGGTDGNGNDIFGNTSYGAQNSVASYCNDARYNYWGDAAGPNDPDAANDGCMGAVSNASAGDTVSQDVNYAAFLAAPIAKPIPPSLNAPANPSEVAAVTPTLVLNDSPNMVDSYTFEIAADLEFSTDFQASPATPPGGGGTTSWVVAAPLAENTLYYWRAKAMSGATESPYSETWRFFVNAVNDPPYAPTPVSPADGAISTSATPTLVVGNADDRDDSIVTNYALTYAFEVYSDSGLTTLATSKSGVAEGASGTTSWVVSPSLATNTWYYWRARAHDGVQSGDWSVVFSFRVNTSNAAPTAPTLNAPANGAEVPFLSGNALTINNSTDSNGDTLTYDFEIYADRNLTTLVETAFGVAQGGGGTTTYVQGAGLEESEIYYWRAYAYDGLTWSAPMTLASLRTRPIALPAPDERGYISGSDQSRPEEVRYRFAGRSGAVTVEFEGYDIDADEVEVSLNGNTPQALAALTAGDWSTPIQLTFPDVEVNDESENVLTFNNVNNPPSLAEWGVRNVTLLGPAIPQGVTATAYNTVVDVRWSENTDALTVGYNIYWASASGGPYAKVNGSLIPKGATAFPFRHVGLANDVPYYYVVRSVDAGTNESFDSAEAMAVPSALNGVTPVTDLRVSLSGADVRLKWTHITNSPEVVSYRVFRRAGAPLEDADVDLGLASPYYLGVDSPPDGVYDNANAAIDANDYYYEVRTFDGSAQSDE